MAKTFYTEKEIEDLFRGGIMSLEVGDNVVLTELAYEKARALGLKLVQDQPENPPSAPVRPYITRGKCACAAEPPIPAPAISVSSDIAAQEGPMDGTNLHRRIHSAVSSRLGNQVDSNLLDVIIKRVLNSTGVKEPVCCSAEYGGPQSVPSNPAAPRG